MSTSLRDLRPEYAPLAFAFVRYLQRLGLGVTINSVRRDADEQAQLWANYQRCGCSSCPPRAGHCFPAAPPGHSPHALGIAWDMSVTPAQLQRAVGELWERLGYRWGGNFSHADPVHFDFYPRGYA